MSKSQAHAAFANGDWETGLAIWKSLMTADSTAAELLEHGLLLVAYYRIADATEVFAQLTRHHAATPAELLPAARKLFELTRFGPCAEVMQRAAALDPQNPDTLTLYATALERSGDKDQAQRILIDVLQHHPRHVQANRLLAHIERRNGQFDAATSRLKNALATSQSDDDWRLQYELGSILDRMGDYTGAMAAMLTAKQQLAPAIREQRPLWRARAQRQWEVSQLLTQQRLADWQKLVDQVEPPLALCLMAGFPRSGTTLLEQIITTHDGCIGTDESGILNSQFRDPIVFGDESAAAAIAELDELESEDITAGRVEFLRCTAEHIGEPIRSRILIEKDPLLTADLALPLRLFPEAKILMPLRDPRDVVISFFFTIVPLAPHSVAAGSIEDACRYYAEVMRHWLLLRERLDPAQWMESRYEDLLDAPELQTRRLCDFLGLTWSPSMTTHHRRPATRAVSTPTYDDVSKPLYRRAQGRWKNYEAWLAPHLHHLAPYVAAFGYES